MTSSGDTPNNIANTLSRKTQICSKKTGGLNNRRCTFVLFFQVGVNSDLIAEYNIMNEVVSKNNLLIQKQHQVTHGDTKIKQDSKEPNCRPEADATEMFSGSNSFLRECAY